MGEIMCAAAQIFQIWQNEAKQERVAAEGPVKRRSDRGYQWLEAVRGWDWGLAKSAKE